MNIDKIHCRRAAFAFVGAWVLTGCWGSDNPGSAKIAVPSVVGMTQTAAATSITGVGLKVGTATMASSASVASGSVISENPAAGTKVASGSAVNLTVSSGPAQVAVPKVVGLTQAAATTSITGASLTLGTVTTQSSATVPSGSVISQSPAAATKIAAGSAVNLTVSSGAAAGFAYVMSNSGEGALSTYSINPSTGALTALSASSINVIESNQFYENKIDPSGKFLYFAADNNLNGVVTGWVYAYSINPANGSLTAVAGSPFAAGSGAQSLAFDKTGSHLYVANYNDNTISAYSLNGPTGALTPLANSPYTITGTNPQPSQIATAGNYLYVADFGAQSIDVFAINADTGELTEGVTGSPFATNAVPVSLAVDPSGSVLYTANAIQNGSTSISAFTLDASTGVPTPVAGNPLAIPVAGFISVDPQGKFLFVPEVNFTTGSFGVAVYPFDTTTGLLGAAVAGSPFATGTNPYSVSVDPTDHFVYVANDQSANVSEFTLDSSTGALTPVPGSPIASGSAPVFIAIE